MRFERDERVERRRARRRQVRRRRLAALVIVAGVGTLVAVSTTSVFGPSHKQASEAIGTPDIEIFPGGGTQILPKYRVVAYYGSPGGTRLGVLGGGTPEHVAEQAANEADDYGTLERPALPAFELIATIARDTAGSDGKYRSRLTDAQIDEYVAATEAQHMLLVLDIQPGRAPFMDEVRHYERWLKKPHVSLALDPEWSMKANEFPGKQIGQTDAATVNEVSAYLDGLTKANHLPQKLLIVHEFTSSMIENRSAIVKRPHLATVFNVDGFGPPDAKINKYNDLTSDPERPEFVFTGFKLFFEEDERGSSRIMTWSEVLGLTPQPDVIVYE